MILLNNWKRDIIYLFYSKDEALREADGHDKAMSLVVPGEQEGDTLPTPTPPLSLAPSLLEFRWLLCGNVWSDHSLSWPMWLKYSCLFINWVYSEKSTNWRTRRDYQVISFNLLHLLCPPGKDCGKRIGLGSRRTKLKFLL